MKSTVWMTLALCSLAGSAIATPPKLDPLVCKRKAGSLGELAGDGRMIVDLASFAAPATKNAEGSLAFSSAPENKDGSSRGVKIDDLKAGTSAVVHSKDKDYDCDMPVSEGNPNSALWVGNDLVFLQGWFCEEFSAKPWLVNARTKKFLSFLPFDVTPEAVYHVAPLDPRYAAMSVWEHNGKGESFVVLLDTKSGKVVKKLQPKAAALAKLPDCAK